MNISFREGRRQGKVSTRVISPKRAALLAGAAGTLIALASTTPAGAATALMVSGIGKSTLPDATMSLCLDGKYTGIDPASGTPWQRQSVSWPARDGTLFGVTVLGKSVAQGTTNLVQAIKTTSNSSPDPITVIGISAGSIVVDETMRELASDPSWQPSTPINFVVLADASQKRAGSLPNDSKWNPFSNLSGYTFKPPPVTPYNLTVVTYEYDGWADFPDRWWNGLAVANAMAGALILHDATWLVDLSTVPASDITVTTNAQGGVTTSYLVEPQTLPLVTLHPRLAPKEAELKQKIDAGYTRNDPKPGNNSPSSPLTAVSALTPNGQSTTPTIVSPVDAPTKPPPGNTTSTPVRPIRALIDRIKSKVANTIPQADPKPANTARTKDNGLTKKSAPKPPPHTTTKLVSRFQ